MYGQAQAIFVRRPTEFPPTTLTTILLIILILAVLGGGNFLGGTAYPCPSFSLGGLVVIILIVLLVTWRI